MRYVIGFIWLMICLFIFSCTGQKGDIKGDQENQINRSETKWSIHRESLPMGIESLKYIPGEILIKFKDGTDVESIRTLQKRLALTTIYVAPRLNIYRMKIQNDISVEEVMKRLQSFREVEYSEPNYLGKIQ